MDWTLDIFLRATIFSRVKKHVWVSHILLQELTGQGHVRNGLYKFPFSFKPAV
uniref:Uncharacterized protein n=1 Tax=Anguilla anguilla TaxID=7936 RepID=A0A0E9SPN8_ANGAN